MHHAPTPPTQPPTTATPASYPNTNNNGYYNNYYVGTDNNQALDAPIQYPNNAEPANTMKGFQELGVCLCFAI